MAVQKPNNCGKGGSGRGVGNRARSGHGHERPSDDPRQQQRNSATVESAIRQGPVESSGQQGNSSTNNTGEEEHRSQTGGGRGTSTAPRKKSSGGNQGRVHAGSGWGARKHQTGNQTRGGRPSQGFPPLALASNSSLSQVADLSGAVASRLTNNTLGGGNTDHWYSGRPGNRVWGEPRGGGVDDQIEDLKTRSGASSVQFFLVANVEGRFETVSSTAVESTWEDANAQNDKGEPAGILRSQVNHLLGHQAQAK